MNKTISSLFIILVTLNFAFADSAKKQPQATLIFSNIVIPEAPPVAAVMVAYMNISNNSNNIQTIIKISSPQFKRVEVHEMSMHNGMMNMRQLKTLSIKAKQHIVLKSGGIHVMLIQPIKPLQQGNNVELMFQLSSGELATIKTQVKRIE